MTFLREIWDKKAAKREVEVTTRKEYEEKVSSLRNGIDYGVTVNNDVAMRITGYLQRSGYVLRILLPAEKIAKNTLGRRK